MVSDQKDAIPADPGAGRGQTDYKRFLAYQHLGIDPKDVQCVPFFRTNLRRIARLLNRRRDKDHPHDAPVRPLELLQSSSDPESRNVLAAYLSVPQSYRRLLPLEAFCLAAGISPWRVLEIITVVAVRQGAQASAVLAALVHPRVVEKTVERAQEDDGTRERMMLHKAVGFMPIRG